MACPSGKRGFKQRNEATKASRAINGRQKHRRGERPVRAYRCRECDEYHLTSVPDFPNRKRHHQAHRGHARVKHGVEQVAAGFRVSDEMPGDASATKANAHGSAVPDPGGSNPPAVAINDVRDEARALMLRTKGYGDRPGRKGNVERLLFKNFGQRPPMRDVKAYQDNFERTFGKDRTPVEYGKRDGYSVKPYRGSVLPVELDLPPEDEDMDSEGEVFG
jgi:hypothetical protein